MIKIISFASNYPQYVNYTNNLKKQNVKQQNVSFKGGGLYGDNE